MAEAKENWNEFLNLIEAKLAKKNKEISDLKDKLKGFEDTIKNLYHENEQLNKILSDLSKDKNLKDDVKNLIEENSILGNEVDKLKRENQRMLFDIENLKKENERLNNENEKLLKEVGRLNNEIKLLKEVESPNNENEKYLKEIGRLNNENEKLLKEIGRLQMEIEQKVPYDSEHLKREIDRLNGEIDKLSKENNRLHKENDRQHDELEKLKVGRKRFENLYIRYVENFNINGIKTRRAEFPLNESFSEKNYSMNKGEVDKLKNELSRQKEEILDLLKENNALKDDLNRIMSNFSSNRKITNEVNLTFFKEREVVILDKQNVILQSNENLVSNSITSEMTQKMQFELTKSDCSMCCNLMERFNELKLNLKYSIFKELKNFYINYQVDIEKANCKLEEVLSKITHAENQFLNENNDQKTKTSKVKEILSKIKMLVSILGVFIGKYNKEIYFYTQNLKKVFDFVQKLVYSSTSVLNMGQNHSCSVSSERDAQMLKVSVPKFEGDKKRSNNFIDCKNKLYFT